MKQSLFVFFILIAGLVLPNTVLAAEWYVRASTTPGTYGAENGTSHADAWNGWSDIVWGVSGVSAGDTLYFCGNHAYSSTISLGLSGAASGTETIIDGNCPSDPGMVEFSNTAVWNIQRPYFNIRNITASSTNNIFYHNLTNNIEYDNLTVIGGTTGILFPANVNGTSSNITITNSDFSGQSASSIRWLVLGSNDTVINNIVISDNTFTNVGAGGVELRSDTVSGENAVLSGVTVTDNTFSNCTSICIRVMDYENTAFYGWSRVNIQRNTVDSAFGAMAVGGFGASDFGDNIIAGNTATNLTGATGGINVFHIEYLDVYDNVVSSSTTDTIDGNGVLVDHGNNHVRVHHNYFSDLAGKDGIPYSGVGVMVLDSTNVDVYHNVGDGNKQGLWVAGVTFATGTPDIINLYNNSFTNNTDSGLYIAMSADNVKISALTVKNNILTGDGSGIGLNDLSTGGGDSIWDNNILYNFSTWYANHASGTSDILADPLLVNGTGSFSTSTDYMLQATSPAIDVGSTTDSLSSDYAGNSIYGQIDIGAYEYQSSNTIDTNDPASDGEVRIYGDGRYRYLNTPVGNSVDFNITPVGGWSDGDKDEWYDVVITEWETTGNRTKSWTASSTGSANVTFSIGDLTPNANYQLRVDGGPYSSGDANGSGVAMFTYSGGWSTHTFEVTKSSNGSKSGSIRYGCHDKKASNYQLYSREDSSLCEYVEVSTETSTESPIISTETSYEDLLSQLRSLQEMLAKLKAKAGYDAGTDNTICAFTRDLTFGMEGDDVRCLQIYLNTHGFSLAENGLGSPSNETNLFGVLTHRALLRFQQINADSILTPLGLSQATGYFGKSTRDFIINY